MTQLCTLALPLNLRAPHPVPADDASIHGVRLAFDTLVDNAQLADASLASLRSRFLAAEPFAHVVIDGLFDPALLELVHAEFDLLDETKWRRSIDGKLEHTYRSMPDVRLGPAAEMYFAAVNAGWFLAALSRLTGIDDLIADTHLHNGGLHEARSGGMFAVHADFDRHPCTRLHNEMVLITYLNKAWDPAYHGALELWDAATRRAVSTVEPVFGRSILMRHGPASLHGHPTPMQLPPGYARRSLASYYYTNRHPDAPAAPPGSSTFLHPGWARTAKAVARELTPPLVWRGVKRVLGR